MSVVPGCTWQHPAGARRHFRVVPVESHAPDRMRQGGRGKVSVVLWSRIPALSLSRRLFKAECQRPEEFLEQSSRDGGITGRCTRRAP